MGAERMEPKAASSKPEAPSRDASNRARIYHTDTPGARSRGIVERCINPRSARGRFGDNLEYRLFRP